MDITKFSAQGDRFSSVFNVGLVVRLIDAMICNFVNIPKKLYGNFAFLRESNTDTPMKYL